MKPSEPIGNAAWGAFFVRVAVGCFFVLKGLNEIQQAPLAIQANGMFRNMPPHMGMLLGILIPYLEVAAGGMLVVGFWTTVGAFFASIIALFFVYVVGVAPRDFHSHLLNKDLIVLAASLSLLYSGAGALSVDKFRKSS